METEEKHFIYIIENYSFANCRKAYHFYHAGLKQKGIARLLSDNSRPCYKNKQIREMIQAYTETLKFEAEIEVKRQEFIKVETPYYEREIGSWENEVITSTSKGKHCWYAVLDTRGSKYCNMDFLTGAETKQDAIRFCALKIRFDVLGVGKFAPHGCLQGYDLNWNLASYWRKKETRRNYRQRKKLNS